MGLRAKKAVCHRDVVSPLSGRFRFARICCPWTQPVVFLIVLWQQNGNEENGLCTVLEQYALW